MTNIKCLPLGRGGRLLTCVLLLSAPAPAMGQDLWTLDASVRRILDIAPENRGADAEVEARRGALRQAGAWPNPTIELRGDDKIGKDEGVGGVDLTQFVLSQPLPLSGRIGHRRAVAKAELSSARAAQKYQQLLLETEAARHFHALQLAGARLNLAQQRLQLADELQNAGRRRQEAGELAQLDRLRLDLLREAAQQILDVAEGRYNEALSRFRTSLGLPAAHVPRLAPLEHFGPIPDLARLRAALSEHPALDATRRRVGAKRSEVELLRSERLVAHERVRKGQVLARLRSHDLGQAQADYLEALARYDLAWAERARIEGLWKDGVVAENRWLKVDSEYKVTRATLRARQRLLSLAGLSDAQIEQLAENPDRLAAFDLISPIDGLVTGVEIESGQFLSAG